jgi:replication factor C large subunit
MNQMFSAKYSPKKLEGMAGNEDKIEYARQWILQWLSGKKRKPLLVHGPPGVGKTSLAYAMMNQYDLDIIEMNASELRNKGRVERVLGGSSLAGSLFGRGRIILIDDADVLAGKADFGGGAAIAGFLRDSSCPIIVTATDIWDKKLSGIRAECDPLEFKKINKVSIRKMLEPREPKATCAQRSTICRRTHRHHAPARRTSSSLSGPYSRPRATERYAKPWALTAIMTH